MELYINDTLTEVSSCIYEENAGGRCDKVYVTASVQRLPEALKKGAVLRAVSGEADSGDMYISDISYSPADVGITALSTPAAFSNAKNMAWRNISFKELVQGLAKKTGFEPVLADSIDAYYQDVTMIEKAPLSFLNERLLLEGYECGVNDSKIYIYDEKRAENEDYTLMLSDSDFESGGRYAVTDKGLLGQAYNNYVTEKGQMISTIVKSGLDGAARVMSMKVDSIAQSERFCKGIMRQANKYEKTGIGTLSGYKVRAKDVIYIKDAPIGMDGANYVYKVIYDFVQEKQTLYFRKPIEGDY